MELPGLPQDEPRQIFQMRQMRDMLLRNSDWTQMPDSPLLNEQKQAWAVYRQALRDFPATWTAGPTAEFPDPPGGE